MAVGFLLCLCVACVLGRHRIFWEDEMLGWMLLHDPSWRHMVEAWNQGADGGGFSFYLLGRAWFAVFGASDLSFRLFSATCFGSAFCVVWATARRFYRTAFVGVALFNVWFFCPPMVTHMAEGRFYGLLVLSTSLVVWLVLKREPLRVNAHPARSLTWLCLLTFFCHALLTTSHILGVLYSGALLASSIVLDLRVHRLRIPVYIAAASSWLLLLPERTAIRASANVGKPWFWIRPPGPARVLGAFTGFSTEISALLFSLGVLLLVSRNARVQEVAAATLEGFRQRRPVYLIAGGLALVPIGIAIGSRFGTSLFLDRYLLPVNIAVALMTMELLRLVRWRSFVLYPEWSRFAAPARVVAGTLFALGLIYFVFHYQREHPIQASNYTDGLTARLPKGVPVLCEDAWAFTELMGRQHNSGVLYTYMLDWPQSVSPAAPRLEVTQYHLMENWKKVGYFSGSIESRDDFLRRYDRFFVLTRQITPVDRFGRFIGNPLAERFAHTPGYQVQMYRHGDVDNIDDPNIWLVCRETCARRL